MEHGQPHRHEQLRLGLTSLVLSVVAMLGVVLWSLTITSLSLIVLTLGIPTTLMAVAGVRRFADRHRRWVTEFTGVPVPRPYRPMPEQGWVPILIALARDPATWRDMAWLILNATVGFAIALVPGILLLATVWYMATPLVYLTFGDDALRLNYMLFTIHDLATSRFSWLLAGICFALLHVTGPPVLRLYVQLTRWLLAPTARKRDWSHSA